MLKPTNLYSKYFKDKNGKLVIAQFPNAPLLVWLVFSLLAHIVRPGRSQQLAHDISLIALFIWALLEITTGTTLFRRSLGLVVLGVLLVNLL